jgi:hypothetical protein
VRQRSQLNDRQLRVLKGVAGGDELTSADNGTKRSANALHDRGLLIVRRSPWRAVITDAGRFYLEHGRYPDRLHSPASSSGEPPIDQLHRADPTPRPKSSVSTASSSRPKPQRRPPHTTARITVERRTAAVELVDELVVAGAKVIRQPDDAAQTHWRQVVDFAKRNNLIPAGKRIEKATTSWGTLRIRLLNGPHPNSRRDRTLPVVPMPTELRGLHPVVKAIQDDSGRLHMGGSLRHRCLLYFHGLTQEAVRRGYGVQAQPIADRHRGRITTYGRPGVPDYSRREGELNVVVDGFSYLITVDQQHPEAEDLERYDQLYVWVRGPGHTHDGCRTHWRDGKRATIDDSIASVLGEIETWAAAAEREKDDRHARWQAAMDEAPRLATHAQLAAELEQQVRHWRDIQELRQYCDSLEVRIQDADDDEPVDEARRWLAWARDHAEVMDPLSQLPTTPTPTIRPEDLEPYLDGWSPHDPDEYRRRSAAHLLTWRSHRTIDGSANGANWNA